MRDELDYNDFTLKANETEVSEYNYKWEVPVTYITSENQERTLTWLHRDDPSIEM